MGGVFFRTFPHGRSDTAPRRHSTDAAKNCSILSAHARSRLHRVHFSRSCLVIYKKSVFFEVLKFHDPPRFLVEDKDDFFAVFTDAMFGQRDFVSDTVDQILEVGAETNIEDATKNRVIIALRFLHVAAAEQLDRGFVDTVGGFARDQLFRASTNIWTRPQTLTSPHCVYSESLKPGPDIDLLVANSGLNLADFRTFAVDETEADAKPKSSLLDAWQEDLLKKIDDLRKFFATLPDDIYKDVVKSKHLHDWLEQGFEPELPEKTVYPTLVIVMTTLEKLILRMAFTNPSSGLPQPSVGSVSGGLNLSQDFVSAKPVVLAEAASVAPWIQHFQERFSRRRDLGNIGVSHHHALMRLLHAIGFDVPTAIDALGRFFSR